MVQPPSHAPPAAPRILVWMMVPALVIAFVAGTIWLRRGHQRRVDAWRASTISRQIGGIYFNSSINAHRDESWAQVQAAVQQKMVDVTRQRAPDTPDLRVGHVYDPSSGFTFELVFWHDRLYRSYGLPQSPPPAPAALVVLENVRSWSLRLSWIVFLALVVEILLIKPMRRLMSGVLLLFSLLVLASAILSVRPGVLAVVDGVEVYLGIVGTLLSVGIVIWVHRRPRSREVLCPRCGYNLQGNRSGVCPECGAPISLRLQRRLAPKPPPLPNAFVIEDDLEKDPEADEVEPTVEAEPPPLPPVSPSAGTET